MNRKNIKSLEESINKIKMTLSRVSTTTLAILMTGIALAPLTFGISATVATAISGVSLVSTAACTFPLYLKEKELGEAKGKIDKKNLEAAVEEYKSQCDYFEDLKNALKDE